MQRGRKRKLLHEETEFDHLDPADIGKAGSTEEFCKMCSELTGESIMDQFHRRHSTTDNPFLIGEVELLDVLRLDGFNTIFFDLALGEASKK
jgi:hypothetical protein